MQAISYLDRALSASKELADIPASTKAWASPFDQPAALLAQRGSIYAQMERFGNACASFKAALQLDISCCLVGSSCSSTDSSEMLIGPLIVSDVQGA